MGSGACERGSHVRPVRRQVTRNCYKEPKFSAFLQLILRATNDAFAAGPRARSRGLFFVVAEKSRRAKMWRN